MITTLIIVVIVMCISTATAYEDYGKSIYSKSVEIARSSIIRSIMFCPIAVLALYICVCGTSYGSYIDTRTFYDATIEQYASAVEMYEDKAVIDIESAAFTDLKYQGYQDNVSGLILSLRRSIIKYNKKLISKRIMKKNLFFNWLIVAPDDDMKILKMSTAKYHVK